MNVALVIPQIGSYRVFLSGLCAHMVGLGWRVSVLTDNGGRTEYDAGVQIVHVPIPRGASPLGHLGAVIVMRRVLAKLRPDIVHAHFSSAIFSCALASVGRYCSVSWCTFQGLGYPLRSGAMGLLLRWVEPWAASTFDRIEVLTEDDRCILHGVLPTREVVRQQGFGFGCEDRFIDAPLVDQREKDRLLGALAPGASRPVFLYLGRLVEFKGFGLAVRAFQAFRRRYGRGSLVVVGELDPQHPSGLTTDEWHAVRVDPAIYLAGWQADPLPWFDCANAMLFFSRREGMPVSVMEALSRGVPIIGHPSRGTRDLVVSGSTGILTDATDPEVVAGLMDNLIKRSRVCDLSASNSLRRSNWIDSTVKAYNQLLHATN